MRRVVPVGTLTPAGRTLHGGLPVASAPERSEPSGAGAIPAGYIPQSSVQRWKDERDRAVHDYELKHQEAIDLCGREMRLEADLEDATKALDKTKRELDEVKAAYTTYRSKCEYDQERVNTADEVVSKITAEKEELADALKKALRAQAGYESNLAALKDDLNATAALHERLAELNERMDMYQLTADMERKKNADHRRKIADLEAELAAMEL